MTLVNAKQSLNALGSMAVTEDGIVTNTKALQPAKACDPMLVTDGGIVTLVMRAVSQTPHSTHDALTMVVVPAGMLKWPDVVVPVLSSVVVIILQWFNLSSFSSKKLSWGLATRT